MERFDPNIFTSMQSRLTPDEQVVERLKERLAGGEPARRIRPMGLAAAAACLVLAIAAVPVIRALQPASVPLHSVVTDGTYEEGVKLTADAAGTGDTGHAAPVEEEAGAVSDAEEELPGGAYVGETESISEALSDEAAQEEAMEAYQNLMAHFEAELGTETWPDWYGGAYLQGPSLIVCVVDAGVPEEYWIDAGGDPTPGKEFYLQIQEWAGNGTRTDAVGFQDVKYSLAALRALQEQITALPELQYGDSWGCGVNEMTNQVELDVPQADRAMLAALAVLDPEDDAILVRTGSAVLLDE